MQGNARNGFFQHVMRWIYLYFVIGIFVTLLNKLPLLLRSGIAVNGIGFSPERPQCYPFCLKPTLIVALSGSTSTEWGGEHKLRVMKKQTA